MVTFGVGNEREYLLPGKPSKHKIYPRCTNLTLFFVLFIVTSALLTSQLHNFLPGEEDLGEREEVEASVGKDIIPKLLAKEKCHSFLDESSCDSDKAPNCLWNDNLKSCELCRKLTRKKQQYDEADACGMDDYVLSCDMYASGARIFVRQVKQDFYRNKEMTEEQKTWKSKMRARTITTYCAQNMDQEKSLCRVDRDVFVTPGTNEESMFTIKFVCIYETEMIGEPKPYPMENKVVKKLKPKKRSAEELEKIKKKIEKRRKLAKEKAEKKLAMENACAAKSNEEECSVGCFWNERLPVGERCKLCRGLSRKNPQYDEADVCLSDYFTLSCDDRGVKARIFVREVIQDAYAGPIEEAKKDYQSKYRARRITMFCAIGKNFDNNRCKFRRYQFAGGDVAPGAVYTIKYACFYANNLPKVPHIFVNLNDTTPQEMALLQRLQTEQNEENELRHHRKEAKKANAAAEKAAQDQIDVEEPKKKKRKGLIGAWDDMKDWTENAFKSKKQKRKEKEAKEARRQKRKNEIISRILGGNSTNVTKASNESSSDLNSTSNVMGLNMSMGNDTTANLTTALNETLGLLNETESITNETLSLNGTESTTNETSALNGTDSTANETSALNVTDSIVNETSMLNVTDPPTSKDLRRDRARQARAESLNVTDAPMSTTEEAQDTTEEAQDVQEAKESLNDLIAKYVTRNKNRTSGNQTTTEFTTEEPENSSDNDSTTEEAKEKSETTEEAEQKSETTEKAEQDSGTTKEPEEAKENSETTEEAKNSDDDSEKSEKSKQKSDDSTKESETTKEAGNSDDDSEKSDKSKSDDSTPETTKDSDTKSTEEASTDSKSAETTKEPSDDKESSLNSRKSSNNERSSSPLARISNYFSRLEGSVEGFFT